ncbi:unnamed protein product, partial [Prorocentrum cordatum]
GWTLARGGGCRRCAKEGSGRSRGAMGKLHTISRGYRHGTRNAFSKKWRCKGEPGVSRLLVNFKRGDFVDIVVDPSIQKGMPHSFFNGKTGIVFNVNRNALGVEMTKIVGNRQLKKDESRPAV